MTEYSLSCCGGSVKIIFDYSLKRESKLSSKISQISANISQPGRATPFSHALTVRWSTPSFFASLSCYIEAVFLSLLRFSANLISFICKILPITLVKYLTYQDFWYKIELSNQRRRKLWKQKKANAKIAFIQPKCIAS